MSCTSFWTARLTTVSAALVMSCLTIWVILRYRLQNKPPMKFILRIACCQVVMWVCTIGFAIGSLVELADLIVKNPNTGQYQFPERGGAAYILTQIEGVIFKSAELTSFCMLTLFTVKLEQQVKDDGHGRNALTWLTRLSYFLPTVLMLLAVLLGFNGLCLVQGGQAVCIFNNACSSHAQGKFVGSSIVALGPSVALFTIQLVFIVRIEWYISKNRRRIHNFTNNQLLGLTIHTIPIWTFVCFIVSRALNVFAPRTILVGYFHNVAFLSTLAIMWTVLRYKNYYVDQILQGKNLDEVADRIRLSGASLLESDVGAET